jgi:hypothetical protein
MARKYKKNGVEVSTALNKNKKYKYDSTGDLVEFTGDPGTNEITIAGSKSSLRRMADMERNISILATTLTTTDDGVSDSNSGSFDSNVNKKTRFKKEVRIDTTLNMQASIDMNGDKITELDTPTAGTDAANKSYVDTKVAALADSAPAALDTLNELAAALGDDASFSTTVTNSIATKMPLSGGAFSGAVTTNSTFDGRDVATDGAKLDGIAAGATNVTNNNQLTNGAGYITSYVDTNTTYTAGNGLTLTGTDFTMSGSYTGSFTATGDITAYSDDSLKTNVQVIDGALGKVEAIRGVTFERIEDGSVSTGVIAQELKAVLPEAVHTDAEGVHSVAYGNITGLLIEAVKELSAQVEELKKK